MNNNHNNTPAAGSGRKRFQNFAILTLQAQRDTWVNAAGTFAALPARLVIAEEGNLMLSMPVVVKAFQAAMIERLRPIREQQLITCKGELRFDTRQRTQDGELVEVKEYALIAVEVKPFDPSQQPSAYLKITAHLLEPEMQYSSGGNPWTKVRAFVSMGKIRDSGEFRDPLWLNIKGFTDKKTRSEALPIGIAKLPKGAVATFAGRLQFEEYQTVGDQTIKTSLNLIASQYEPFDAAPAAADSKEGYVVEGL